MRSVWASFAVRSARLCIAFSTSLRDFDVLVSIALSFPFRFGTEFDPSQSVLACNIVNLLWIAFCILIVSFRCIPFSKWWDITGSKQGYCLGQLPVSIAIASWGFAIELVIWILPIPMCWNLQIPFSSKIALTVIFGLGIFDIGVGVGRLVTLLQVDVKDSTYTEVSAMVLFLVEPSIAIVVACLCVCRPLLEEILPRSWRQALTSNRLGDDHIKLVNWKGASPLFTADIRGGIDGGDSALSHLDGTVSVRNEITVTASTIS